MLEGFLGPEDEVLHVDHTVDDHREIELDLSTYLLRDQELLHGSGCSPLLLDAYIDDHPEYQHP